MFGFGHIFEIIGLLFVALLVFGPKRMIEMGSSFGKALRELRDATKEMNWTSPAHDDHASTPKNTYTVSRSGSSTSRPQPPDASTVVESTIEPPQDSAS
jgi:TatA/E family protein of Tat protein translocase